MDGGLLCGLIAAARTRFGFFGISSIFKIFVKIFGKVREKW